MQRQLQLSLFIYNSVPQSAANAAAYESEFAKELASLQRSGGQSGRSRERASKKLSVGMEAVKRRVTNLIVQGSHQDAIELFEAIMAEGLAEAAKRPETSGCLPPEYLPDQFMVDQYFQALRSC
eukprot:CAMPEP_0202914106 /NCGR_PEP_ID=MMETSP1392-20130828/62249_1 /ASSEMBLY_ACC=CAM_ASM_000868 /TAXON_ID=225041 /ORGANISM="Chlamydomonas chlamydogama, Strain SAG 11-48b" /LENGTH=123 /DNA_ID=CAMNT_0049605627 /DNA_START=83 /DNA_END=452 /DNA_ORIENTATION=+